MRRINKIHAWQVVEIEAIPLQGRSVLRRLFHSGTATKTSSTRPRRNVISSLYISRSHRCVAAGLWRYRFYIAVNAAIVPGIHKRWLHGPLRRKGSAGLDHSFASPVDSYRNLYTLPGQISHLVSPSSGAITWIEEIRDKLGRFFWN